MAAIGGDSCGGFPVAHANAICWVRHQLMMDPPLPGSIPRFWLFHGIINSLEWWLRLETRLLTSKMDQLSASNRRPIFLTHGKYLNCCCCCCCCCCCNPVREKRIKIPFYPDDNPRGFETVEGRRCLRRINAGSTRLTTAIWSVNQRRCLCYYSPCSKASNSHSNRKSFQDWNPSCGGKGNLNLLFHFPANNFNFDWLGFNR